MNSSTTQPRGEGVQIRARHGLSGPHIGWIDGATTQDVQQEYVRTQRAGILLSYRDFDFASRGQIQR